MSDVKVSQEGAIELLWGNSQEKFLLKIFRFNFDSATCLNYILLSPILLVL